MLHEKTVRRLRKKWGELAKKLPKATPEPINNFLVNDSSPRSICPSGFSKKTRPLPASARKKGLVHLKHPKACKNEGSCMQIMCKFQTHLCSRKPRLRQKATCLRRSFRVRRFHFGTNTSLCRNKGHTASHRRWNQRRTLE